MLTRREVLLASSALALRAQPGRGPETRLTAVHILVESPPWVPERGKQWDPRRAVELCREAGAGIIEQKTKNEHGHALFPFRGRPCPHDWITGTREEARRAGIPYVAYYNVGLDNWMAREKPEWTCRDAEDKPAIAFGAYNWMCFRSPWHDLVLDELRQVVEATHPESVWFDLLGAPNAYGPGSFDPAVACRCAYCRKAYRESFHEEMPGADTKDPALRWRLNRFGHASRIRMLRDACNLVRSIQPKTWLGSNGAGYWDSLAGTPEDVASWITFNSSEAKDHRGISFKSKLMWSLGKPFQIHSYGGFTKMEAGSAVGTWVAWNLIPGGYLRISAAVAAAHGGRLSVGVNPLPDGSFPASEMKRLGPAFHAANERSAWLAGLESVRDVGIVYDGASDLALMRQPGPRLRVQQEAQGLHNALLEAGLHFDVIDSRKLDPRGYRALVLGDAAAPGAKLREALEAWVRAGGCLVVTGETSLYDDAGVRRADFAWSELLGVRYRGVSAFKEANYGALSDTLRGDAPDYPILFRGPVLEVESTTATPLAELIYPAAHRTPEIFTDGETDYIHPGARTGKPLVTLNRVGKGCVIYVASAIGREILTRNDPWLKLLVVRAIEAHAAPAAITTHVPAGVQVVFGRKADAHVVSLVNHYPGLVGSGAADAGPRVGPVRVEVPVAVLGRAPSAVRAIDAAAFEWKVEGATLRMSAEWIGHHAVLIIS